MYLIDPAVKHLPSGVEMRQGVFYRAQCRRIDGSVHHPMISEHDATLFDHPLDEGMFHFLKARDDVVETFSRVEGWGARLVGMSNWVALDPDPRTAHDGAIAYREAHQPSPEALAEAFPDIFGDDRG